MIFLYNFYIDCYFLLLFLDTQENTSVAETLQKLWAILEQNIEQYAISLLRWSSLMMFLTLVSFKFQFKCYHICWVFP